MRSLNTDIATLAAVLSLSFPIAACAAQSAGVAAGAQASAQASAQSNAIIERYMTSVDTELTGKLDSKNAAVGQQVTAKISQTATLADGTMLPMGTRLVGRVTQVQAESRDQPYAALAISFDRAELKNGQSVALRSEIRMVAPPASTVATSSASLMGADQATGMPGAGGMGGMGSASARGGLGLGSGGGVGGVARGAGGTVGVAGQTAGSTVGDTRSLPNAAADIPGGAVAKAGETVSTAPRATALPGVMLSNSAAGDVSGTLMASGRNISLDAGTQITLGVITR